MRLFLFFALSLSPSLSSAAKGDITYTIVKPGRCPGLLERFTKSASDYYTKIGAYYVYEGSYQLEDFLNPTNSQTTKQRRVTRRQVLPEFQGRKNVERYETWVNAEPMSVSFSVIEKGVSFHWQEKTQSWHQSKPFPDLADGLEFIMHQEGVFNTPYKYTELGKLQWGARKYSDVMSVEMGQPEILNPNQSQADTVTKMTSRTYTSKSVGFLGSEMSHEMKVALDGKLIAHSRSQNVDVLVEISMTKPAGLAD